MGLGLKMSYLLRVTMSGGDGGGIGWEKEEDNGQGRGLEVGWAGIRPRETGSVLVDWEPDGGRGGRWVTV